MTQPIEYATPVVPLDFPNRKTGLMVAGIMLIVMGSLAGCLAILTPVGLILARNMAQQSYPVSGAVVGVFVYVLAAAGLIWVGIGSVRARRWTRPLVLIFATIALTIGVLTLAAMIYMAPNMAQAIQAARPASSPPVPAAAATIGLVAGIGAVVIIYLVIPGIYFWFFRRDDVRKTLEFYDPRPRWTDRCPITVLGMSVACGLAGVCMPLGAAYGVMPLFGCMLKGLAVIAATLPVMGLLFITAVLVYQQRATGWWLAVAVVALFLVSSILNVALLDFEALYAAMGLPPEQVAVVRQNPIGNPQTMIVGASVLSLAAIVYALAIRKHFTSTSATASTQ